MDKFLKSKMFIMRRRTSPAIIVRLYYRKCLPQIHMQTKQIEVILFKKKPALRVGCGSLSEEGNQQSVWDLFLSLSELCVQIKSNFLLFQKEMYDLYWKSVLLPKNILQVSGLIKWAYVRGKKLLSRHWIGTLIFHRDRKVLWKKWRTDKEDYVIIFHCRLLDFFFG